MGKKKAQIKSLSRSARRFPIGAEVMPKGGVHFRVWAPRAREMFLELSSHPWEKGKVRSFPLHRETGGYFSGQIPEASPGMLYKFRIGSGSFPDPASRFQPQGPHGSSQVIDPGEFAWTDRHWRGPSRRGQIVYEMHVGTFSPSGDWRGAMERLPHLVELGVTVLELMPVADFPGRFGWGYDGVNLFAPTQLYGLPNEFRAFVNQAHALGMGVILDVVYNHLGPDGNYLGEFSEDYFSTRYKNEWGEAINFDGKNSEPVREFFISNARYWIEEFHLDGLRLDATQQIFDASAVNVMTEITAAVRAGAKGRSTYVVAENETQEARLARSVERGGFGMDALWNDDFHHAAAAAMTGRNEAYYSDYKGTPQEFISALKWGYLYQGQWYRWQKQRRGRPARDLAIEQFIYFLENHDQVANTLRGERMHRLTTRGRLRAMTALILLGPGTPMLFQGQEFASSAPFLYFADHHPELARLVAKGRREFLSQFKSVASEGCAKVLTDPGEERTFLRCKLDWAEKELNAAWFNLHRDLIALRKSDPVLRGASTGNYDGAVLGSEAFLLRFFGEEEDDRLLLVNLGLDLEFNPAPEPLLAPVEDHVWAAVWSSEHPDYGGCGMAPLESDANWQIPGHAAVLMGAKKREKVHGKNHSKDPSGRIDS